MINGVPRFIIVGIAALFSVYHVVLGLLTLDVPNDAGPVLVAMALYAAATAMSLGARVAGKMPTWMAALNVAVCVALPLLVAGQLQDVSPDGYGYATWYVAGIGTLMTITSTRRQRIYAWVGIGFLVLHTVAWAGPGALVQMGVAGSVGWVAVSAVLGRSIAKAVKDARRFSFAEREAANWQAAQEAHVFERQSRISQTSSMALPMLRQIQLSGGELTDAERQECLYLEGAIRDEIRGRNLLSDAVREQVMIHRRRGAAVTLLDEGGMDGLDEPAKGQVLARLADALRASTADKIIVRTAAPSSNTAVTVVGLRTSGSGESDHDADASALGHDSAGSDEEIDLWLEIPRNEG